MAIIIQMVEAIVPKYILQEKLSIRRRRGRPRQRREDEGREDLMTLKVREWRTMVGDRESWRGIVEATKTHTVPPRSFFFNLFFL